MRSLPGETAVAPGRDGANRVTMASTTRSIACDREPFTSTASPGLMYAAIRWAASGDIAGSTARSAPGGELSAAAAQGRLLTAVHEHERGSAIIAAMSPEAVLLVLLRPHADLGALLFDLRRHRANIAALA